MGEEICHDRPEGAIELCSLFCGCHEVNWDGIHGGLFGRVENESILFPVLDEVVLWLEEDVWHEPCDPCRWRDGQVVAFFFVHGLHDCLQFLCNQWVVSMFVIGNEVFPQACRVEDVGTTRGHDPAVVP